MIQVRKMLPGETRTYNRATTSITLPNGSEMLTGNDSDDAVAVVIGDVVIEFDFPCRVRYSKPGKKR